ncbi:hypothetical protein [Mycobacteroides abscessus]
MADDQKRDGFEFAKYLSEHPDEAKQFYSSIKSIVQQYGLVQNLFVDINNQLQQRQRQIAKAVSSIQFPTEMFNRVGQQLATLFPFNWPRPIPDFDRIKTVLENDGIPIVHIPRAEIVQALVDADGYEARMDIIEARGDDIATDCMTVLDEKYDRGLELQIPLARRAIYAYQEGHFEAAQALAVSVCDTYLKQMFPPEPTGKNGKEKRVGYKEMAARLAIDNSHDASAAWALNIGYALAPAVQFLVDWWPWDEAQPPTRLSRHVSIHNASTDHMTKVNATIAIMLVTSMSVALNYPVRLLTDSADN